jgi:integrase
MGKRGNGEGSITRRKDGLYMARYTVQTATGSKRKAIYGKTRQEVSEKLTKAMADRDGGLIFDAENFTVGEYLNRWLSDSVRGTVRVSTYERHESIIRPHLAPALGRIKLKTLTSTHVRGLHSEKLDADLAPATVRKIHSTLHKALSQAVSDGLVPRNAAAVKAPRPAPEEMRPLSSKEARTLLETARAVGDRFEALYVLAITTGLRRGELLGLRWEDADLERGVLRVGRALVREGGRHLPGETKTKRGRRQIRLTSRAVSALKTHRKKQLEERMKSDGAYEDHGLVFATYIGTPVNPENLVKRSFKPLLERAGLPEIRFHDLRHTCATLLLGGGVHPKLVQELLGHATIAMTLDTYSHYLPSMGDQTARAMEDALDAEDPPEEKGVSEG